MQQNSILVFINYKGQFNVVKCIQYFLLDYSKPNIYFIKLLNISLIYWQIGFRILSIYCKKEPKWSAYKDISGLNVLKHLKQAECFYNLKNDIR